MSENTAATKPETEPSMCSVICARVLRERRCVAKPGRDHIRSYCSGPGDERSVATNSTVRDLCCDLDALDELIDGMIGQLEIYERRLKESKEDASLSRTPPGMSDATANISLAAKAIIGSLPEPNAIGQVAKLVSDLALVANVLTRHIDALEALARTPEREVHDPLCSVGQQAGDQTMPCDCARPSPSTPEGMAETPEQRARRVLWEFFKQGRGSITPPSTMPQDRPGKAGTAGIGQGAPAQPSQS